MQSYGQYCPVAQALELLGDRWTLLIIRDMLTGTRHFNELERGLPGISRSLLAKRLKFLQAVGIVEKYHNLGRKSTEYRLTRAGEDTLGVIEALMVWGITWAFNDPSPEQLDPLLLLWWMHNRVLAENLPQHRVVIQFEFHGAVKDTYWLVLTEFEVDICQTHPGHEVNLVIVADLATFFKLWLGKIDYAAAIDSDAVDICVDGMPRFVGGFPTWFAWSPAAAAVRAIQSAAD